MPTNDRTALGAVASNTYLQHGYKRKRSFEAEANFQAQQERLQRQKYASLPVPRTARWLLLQQQQQQQQPLISLLPSSKQKWLQLRPGRINELAGPAGSGKTQIALQLLVQAAARACPPLYISTSQSSLTKALQRLSQMCSKNSPALLDRIVTRCCPHRDDWMQLLSSSSQQLHGYSAIVVDNLADFFRGQEEQDDNTSRAALLQYSASVLLRLDNVPVLVLNQWSMDRPALGMAWRHLVHESFVLIRNRGDAHQRQVVLRKSNDWPIGATAAFAICSGGVVVEEETTA